MLYVLRRPLPAASAGFARAIVIKSRTRSFEKYFQPPYVDGAVQGREETAAVTTLLREGGGTGRFAASLEGPGARRD